MKINGKFGSYEFTGRGCVSSSSCQANHFYFADQGFGVGCCWTDGCNAGRSLRVEHYALMFALTLSVFVQLYTFNAI